MVSPVKLGILVNAYARTSELQRCLSSILDSTRYLSVEKLILHQTGVSESMHISASFSNQYLLKYVEPRSSNLLECINSNRVQGLSILFEDLNVDAVLAVEDDVEVAMDAAEFCIDAWHQFVDHKDFRGVNLGSRIPRIDERDPTDTFSLLRYGLHGQAGLLTRRTWLHIRQKDLGVRIDSGFDSQIESYLKTGFMVTSNYSRYLDRGFDQYATHAVRDQNDRSFRSLELSYLGKDYVPKSKNYVLHQMNHTSWRKDAIAYKKYRNFEYKLRSKIV
jgi:hypothetical protein